jgi:hypothetical protein
LLVVAGGVIYGGIFLVVAMLLKITELRWIGSLVYKRLRG